MKYEIRYSRDLPTDHDVMELMVAVSQQTGNECESIELIKDLSVSPAMYVMTEKEVPDEWKGE